MAGCFINPSDSLAKDIFTKPTMTVNPGRGLSITDEAALDKMIKNSSGGDFKNPITEVPIDLKWSSRFNSPSSVFNYECPSDWIFYKIGNYGHSNGTPRGYCFKVPTIKSAISIGCHDSLGRNTSCTEMNGNNYTTGIRSVTGCPAGYHIQRVMIDTATWFYFCQKN